MERCRPVDVARGRAAVPRRHRRRPDRQLPLLAADRQHGHRRAGCGRDRRRHRIETQRRPKTRVRRAPTTTSTRPAGFRPSSATSCSGTAHARSPCWRAPTSSSTALNVALDLAGVPVVRSLGASPLERAITEAARSRTRDQLAAWAEDVWAGDATDPMRRRVAEEADRFSVEQRVGRLPQRGSRPGSRSTTSNRTTTAPSRC